MRIPSSAFPFPSVLFCSRERARARKVSIYALASELQSWKEGGKEGSRTEHGSPGAVSPHHFYLCSFQCRPPVYLPYTCKKLSSRVITSIGPAAVGSTVVSDSALEWVFLIAPPIVVRFVPGPLPSFPLSFPLRQSKYIPPYLCLFGVAEGMRMTVNRTKEAPFLLALVHFTFIGPELPIKCFI